MTIPQADHHAANPTRVELRIPVDAAETPNAYEDTWPDTTDLAVELSGPAGTNLLAVLVVPTDQARQWAGDLFTAVTLAWREATGDPHALGDDELAHLPAADSYLPGPGVMLAGGDDGSPARARFHVAVDIQAAFLSTGGLRAAIVEALTERFNVAHIGVSAGEPIAGRPAFE